jgi:hypothetical protein
LPREAARLKRPIDGLLTKKGGGERSGAGLLVYYCTEAFSAAQMAEHDNMAGQWTRGEGRGARGEGLVAGAVGDSEHCGSRRSDHPELVSLVLYGQR